MGYENQTNEPEQLLERQPITIQQAIATEGMWEEEKKLLTALERLRGKTIKDVLVTPYAKEEILFERQPGIVLVFEDGSQVKISPNIGEQRAPTGGELEITVDDNNGGQIKDERLCGF